MLLKFNAAPRIVATVIAQSKALASLGFRAASPVGRFQGLAQTVRSGSGEEPALCKQACADNADDKKDFAEFDGNRLQETWRRPRNY